MEDIKKDILWRVYLVYFGVLLFGLAIIGKAISIQFYEGDELLAKANKQEIKYFTIEASRGNILARDGNLLALTVPVFDIRMDVNSDLISDKLFFDNVDSLAYCLSKLFNDKSKTAYKNDLIRERKEGNRYFLIKKDVNYEQLKKLRSFPIFRLGRFKGGLIAERKSLRDNPYRELALRTIGYEKKDENIHVGLEGYYSGILSGKDGQELKRRINNGDWIPVSEKNKIDPQDGKDILTTIDVSIQDVAESALSRHLAEHEAYQGCAILMEVATGEIRAIANLRYNPKTEKYEEIYNYAIAESVEPGSTFKLASIISAFEDRKVTPNDLVHVGNGEARYANRTMKDVHKFETSYITIRKAFEESSNVGISQMIYNNYRNEPEKFVEHLRDMHLNEPLNIDVPGERPPYIKHPSDKNAWSKVSLPWMSIGYEVQMTPLQILTLYNAIANNGVMVKPMFVKEIQQGGQTLKRFGPTVIDSSICSAYTVDLVRSLLLGVVEEGTGSYVKNDVYKVAGKTGTALIADNNKGYATKIYNASFVGYFPADDPKYSCIVFVNRPKKGKIYGGSVSAPVFKEIADKVYATHVEIHPTEKKPSLAERMIIDSLPGNQNEIAYCLRSMDLPFKSPGENIEWVYTNPGEYRVMLEPIEIFADTIPDLRGWSAKDAVYLLEKLGITPILEGRGRVEAQSVEPGSKAIKGTEMIINLSTKKS